MKEMEVAVAYFDLRPRNFLQNREEPHISSLNTTGPRPRSELGTSDCENYLSK
jgi:hypothetical protein